MRGPGPGSRVGNNNMSGTNIRLAIAGVGNCASALVQGIYHYRNSETTAGLQYETVGGYRVGDISPVCAFDVDTRKAGQDLGTAIHAEPNCTVTFADVPPNIGVPVYPVRTDDGVATHMADSGKNGFSVGGDAEPVDVTERLQSHDVDVLITYLPVGAETAIERYAEAALEAGVAFVNPIPVFIASDERWGDRFADAGLPIVGDDIKSQIGATITHRQLVQLIADRGATVSQTHQLNFGGNTDFRNMLDNSRLTNKEISKTEAVNSLFDKPLDEEDIHIGPSDYISHMDDQKRADIRIVGEMFGGVPFTLEADLRVEDSPNSAGSAVNAIRASKTALDRELVGPLEAAAAITMKHPPEPMTDQQARTAFESFLES